MALEIIKLLVDVTTTTDVVPTVTRFFYKTTAVALPGSTLTIDAASFKDDNGNAVASLPALTSNNSYYNVYINGVLQMKGISTYTPGGAGVGKLQIQVPPGTISILVNTPIILEVVQFAPSSTTTVTT
ncbi:hypothetical protein GGR02_000067 [Anoxybacillus voinovskiensis]|uniref:DUF4183 domain-containing protein n=1 Tax=Anoxybacteroides voinovskiense TaxID=230470 RepID=A0A840DFZ3_9BACL|nr:DUF4183 domain-containing protein [Anoxybacillus voinovskiensis]MBB4072321.1 hypothetical protein [Anoxybacillus voinovskiensis]GGJ58805.1 hypothetical protein GCM10008982_04880 [Anoxybacillus voinovskiensis]